MNLYLTTNANKSFFLKSFFIVVFLVTSFMQLRAQKLNTALNYLVQVPEKINSKTPVLIFLHGYGSNENDLISLSKSIGKGFIIFSLRAPNTMGNGSFCWYPLQFLDNGQFKYDYEIAKQSSLKIVEFIREACKAYKVDSTQVFVLGFSQGAIMAYDIAITNPVKIKGVLALSGRLMNESKSMLKNNQQISRVKIFIGHGSVDERIKIQESEAAQKFFVEQKVNDISFNRYAMPHTISNEEVLDINNWLLKFVSL